MDEGWELIHVNIDKSDLGSLGMNFCGPDGNTQCCNHDCSKSKNQYASLAPRPHTHKWMLYRLKSTLPMMMALCKVVAPWWLLQCAGVWDTVRFSQKRCHALKMSEMEFDNNFVSQRQSPYFTCNKCAAPPHQDNVGLVQLCAVVVASGISPCCDELPANVFFWCDLWQLAMIYCWFGVVCPGWDAVADVNFGMHEGCRYELIIKPMFDTLVVSVFVLVC